MDGVATTLEKLGFLLDYCAVSQGICDPHGRKDLTGENE